MFCCVPAKQMQSYKAVQKFPSEHLRPWGIPENKQKISKHHRFIEKTSSLLDNPHTTTYSGDGQTPASVVYLLASSAAFANFPDMALGRMVAGPTPPRCTRHFSKGLMSKHVKTTSASLPLQCLVGLVPI